MISTKRNIIKIFIFMIIPAAIAFASEIKKEPLLGIRVHYFNYTSYSQQKISMPMVAGYPVLKSSALDFGLNFISGQHEIVFEYAAPVKLTSEGGNSLSFDQNSQYKRFSLDYACHFNLLQRGRFLVQHAVNTGVLYEDRLMVYLRNSSESTGDINFYLGPRIRVNYKFYDTWTLRFDFDGRFYLPYLNIGTLETHDEDQNPIYSSKYYAFYYQTVFGLSLIKEFSDGNIFEFGLQKNDLVGFANSRPLFKIDDLIHFKFDRLFQCYIALDFNLWGILNHED